MPNFWGEYYWWELVPLAADPSRLPKLPTEVWERILDECDVLNWDHDDKRTSVFAACCSTSQAWLPRSRYHLYKYVEVRSKEHVKQVSRMLNLMPALRTRVKALYVFGSRDGKWDASWFGLAGFHLGSKLKALNQIRIFDVDFSLMKPEAYKFWGAFNRSWRTNAVQKLYFQDCAAHVNQLIRRAFETKAKRLIFYQGHSYKQNMSALPAPVLSSGISLPLSYLRVTPSTSDFVLSTPWHTLAKQCPSLSTVEIHCQGESPDVSSPNHQIFLVSILCMFHRMQRHNNANKVRLDIPPLPKIFMRGRPRGESVDAADNASLSTHPRLRRKLNLGYGWNSSSQDPFVKALTWLENAMVLGDYINRRFHQINICGGLDGLPPDSFQSVDSLLSRLLIVTHGRQVTVGGEDQPFDRCVVTWARDRFPMVTAMSPNAFCDPEAGQPCGSHCEQAGGVEQGQVTEEAESGEGRGRAPEE